VTGCAKLAAVADRVAGCKQLFESVFRFSLRRRGRVARRVATAAALLAAASAVAAPPQNADPALAPWFRSLQQPGTAISCCSVADCRPTEYRISADHYEALIGGNWLVVPPDKILQRTDNPTGHAIVCWTPQRGIMCFVRSTES
jgi:hypothetical protein